MQNPGYGELVVTFETYNELLKDTEGRELINSPHIFEAGLVIFNGFSDSVEASWQNKELENLLMKKNLSFNTHLSGHAVAGPQYGVYRPGMEHVHYFHYRDRELSDTLQDIVEEFKHDNENSHSFAQKFESLIKAIDAFCEAIAPERLNPYKRFLEKDLKEAQKPTQIKKPPKGPQPSVR